MTLFSHLDWNAIYLTCFGVGLALTIVSFVGGTLHLHMGHLHLHGHGFGKIGAQANTGQISPVNGFTLVAFLAWFGGAGYLLSERHVFTSVLVLGLAAISGLAGSGVVFWFLSRVMLPRERVLEPADTPIIGVLGRVSAPVTSNGVGEMLYSQNGARRSMPIAAEDGVAIGRGAEVVVLRYHRGIAYVRRWDEIQQVLMGDKPIRQGTDLTDS